MNIFELVDFDFQKNLTKDLLIELFSDRLIDGQVQKKLFNVEDIFSFTLNNKKVSTTVGRFVFNKFVLPTNLFTETFFVNKSIDKKEYKNLFQKIADQLEFNTISREEFANFTDRVQWIGSQFVNTVGDSFDSKSFNLSGDVKLEIKEIVDSIDPENLVSIDSNEKKIVEILKKALKDTPIGKIVESGAKGGWESNIKPLLGIRGLIAGEYSKNSLFGGIDLDTYSRINSLQGSFSRSINTALGGYQVNLLRDGLSYTSISNQTDCHSDGYLSLILVDSIFKQFKHRRIKLLKDKDESFKQWDVLNDSTKEKYIGKAVIIRSIMYCRNKSGYCQTCFGDSFKKNNVTENLSSLPMQIASTIMNKSMKSFHSTAIDRTIVDFSKLVIK